MLIVGIIGVEFNFFDSYIVAYKKSQKANQHQLEIQDAEHEENLASLRTQRTDIKRREIDMAKIQADADKVKAEAFDLISRANLTKPQLALLNKIIAEFDLTNISPDQAIDLIKTLSLVVNQQGNFITQQKMIEQQIEKMKAETANLEAKTDGQRAQVEQDKFVHGEVRKRYNKPGDTPKS